MNTLVVGKPYKTESNLAALVVTAKPSSVLAQSRFLLAVRMIFLFSKSNCCTLQSLTSEGGESDKSNLFAPLK